MPEYLAPGVYVEEVSFRAKSIEGVSTSTTAFVGPTRKGPVAGPSAETPELLTSFADFDRIYGGLDNLAQGLNYVAHAVRAYFDNGGSRLYVARAYVSALGLGSDGKAASNYLGDPDPTRRCRFVARTPGAQGTGEVQISQSLAPATVRTLGTAPDGTMVVVGGHAPAGPAQVTGGTPSFVVSSGGKLVIAAGGAADVTVTFNGAHAEAVAGTALAAPVAVDPTSANRYLKVGFGAGEQAVDLLFGVASPANPTSVAVVDVVARINRQLRGGYARLSDASDAAGANLLVIGCDRQGTSSTVTVRALAGLGFAADVNAANVADAKNNVADLGAVTVDELNRLLGGSVLAATSATNRLVLSSAAAGDTAQLQVRDTSDAAVRAGLGLPSMAAPVKGTAGTTPVYYVKSGGAWQAGAAVLDLGTRGPFDALKDLGGADFVTYTVATVEADGTTHGYDGLALDRAHPRFIGNILAATPKRRADALENPYAIEVGSAMTANQLRAALIPSGDHNRVTLTGGGDGVEPTQFAYEAALAQLEGIEDVSIVAAPGSSALSDPSQAQGVQGALITHAEKRRAYRIAVLDAPPDETVTAARAYRGQFDSSWAALYYPWVWINNPLYRPGADDVPAEIKVPPSGFVAGVYARTDVERGVFKAPANEIVQGALRFELDVNFAQQETLNPVGVNCLRFLTGRGYRVWGARTASSDPEFKYVNVRRYFNYLERSIDVGTQWAVFEPNGDALWANVRETISAFLYNEWTTGALLGTDPKEAFFVRCDRSTMTQNDLDNGRLICLIGVAVVKPAEFVIFRIGQTTADAR